MATIAKRRAAAKKQQPKRHGRFTLIAGAALVVSFLGAACGTTEKESPGTAEPGTPKSAPVSFTRNIKPIFDAKCVGCHACYDSPGQLDLRSVDGIVRGAMKVDTYAARGKPIEPTFVWNSANTLDDWREMGFFSVIEGGRDSIMGKMLVLGHANPVKPNEQFPADIKIDQLERQNYLPNKYEIDGYAEQYPQEGMPLAVSGLSEEEYTATMSWLENGAPIDYEAPDPTANELAEIQKWEAFLNADDKPSKLVARYIFEHLFLVNFLFEDRDDANSFILVRSTTPSGKDTVPVHQHLPNGEVDGKFYYRFMLLELTDCVKNTRLQMLASDEKLDRWKNMFSEEDWSADRLPGYTDAERFNPLGTFNAIPPKARWKFTLDTGWLQNASIVHGPSCHGNMAVGTVQERWWMLFESPDTSLYVNDPVYRAEIDPLVALQQNPDNLMDAFLMQREYLERRKEAIKRAFGRAKETHHRARLADIWRGEYPDDTPFLSFIRHDDNGYAVEGSAAMGDFPKTVWVADLPIMEHAAYSAYINFDVFGDTLSQIFASRQIFGLSRVSNELNFLRFLPVKARRPLFESWYQGELAEAVTPALVPRLQPDEDIPTDIKYTTDDPKREFLEKAIAYLGTRVNADDPINRPKTGDDADRITKALISIVDASREQEPTWRKFKTLLPEAVFLRVDGAGREPVVYTMMHERDYATKGFISMALQDDIPSKAQVMILEGIYTAYPNFMFRINEDEIEEFASTLIDAETQDDLTAIVERWGIRRSSPDFWPVLDSVTAYGERTNPRRAGTFDINRYKNL